MPQSSVLTMQVQDTLGLTSFVPIYVTVQDENDNVCQFTNPSLTASVDQGTNPGEVRFE